MAQSPTGPGPALSRRTLLRGAAFGAGALALPGLLAACGGSSGGGGTTESGGSGTNISFGSNYSDPAPKAAFQGLINDAKTKTGVTTKINTTDHNTFQNNITSYLQGTPDDLATWFAGFRLQYFAAQGLLAPIDDVWDKIGTHFNDAAKSLSKGADGHYYLVPLYNYPWVVHYNKSTFAQKGYEVPTNWDSFIALAKKMKKDGLTPLAFADKDLWPALGTFDILNMRVNGFDYHMKLMQNKGAAYTDKEITAVFDHWRELMPYLQTGANGRIWQDAAKTLEAKQAGMMFQGTNQVAAQYATDKKDIKDLDFFAYPEINSTFGQDYMDAPADGFIMPKKAKNTKGAKKVLEYIGTPEAESSYLKGDSWDVGLATGLVAPTYNDIQKKSATMIAKQKAVAQFGDRDTDPAMATALEHAIQDFIGNPAASNVQSLQKSLAKQAKSIFG
ncbi:MAG TPA: extracellular solute-binding protein [Actinocatenispora sp.]